MSTTLVELAKRLPDRLDAWVPIFIAAELCYGIDPFWLAAIIDQETLGGTAPQLHPKGPKGRGDGGHGHGLGQIDDRSHPSFLGAHFDDGMPLWQDPAFNILYAARLLRKNLELFGGDYFAAVTAYNAGPGNVRKALRVLPPGASDDARINALDRATGRNLYLSRVLQRRTAFLSTAVA